MLLPEVMETQMLLLVLLMLEAMEVMETEELMQHQVLALNYLTNLKRMDDKSILFCFISFL